MALTSVLRGITDMTRGRDAISAYDPKDIDCSTSTPTFSITCPLGGALGRNLLLLALDLSTFAPKDYFLYSAGQ